MTLKIWAGQWDDPMTSCIDTALYCILMLHLL